MSIWRWADLIDFVPEQARITLGEGQTPLVRSRRIGPNAGLNNLWFKLDFVSPTASYKDRFAAATVSHMVAAGKTRCIATSSGNTGASLAAYCAAAGIQCLIAIVEGAPLGKLQQMLCYGATLYRIRGFGADVATTSAVFDLILKWGSEPDAAVQVSSYKYSAPGMTGVETVAFDLAEQVRGRVCEFQNLPETRWEVGKSKAANSEIRTPDPAFAIDHLFCPAGGGGLAVAAARGFRKLVDRGVLAKSPAIEVVQPEGNDTMATPLRDGHAQAREVTSTTRISGLQVPTVNDGHWAVTECRASGGSGHVVTDAEVWETQRRLARDEGIFTEPAGAVAVAGALRAARERRLAPDAHIICMITGSGFKDPHSVEEAVAATAGAPLVSLEEFAKLGS